MFECFNCFGKANAEKLYSLKVFEHAAADPCLLLRFFLHIYSCVCVSFCLTPCSQAFFSHLELCSIVWFPVEYLKIHTGSSIYMLVRYCCTVLLVTYTWAPYLLHLLPNRLNPSDYADFHVLLWYAVQPFLQCV